MANRQFFVHDHHGVVLVKDGFCWPAFILGALWAAAKGLWIPVFAAMMAVEVVLWFLTGYAGAQRHGGLALLGFVAMLGYAWVRGRYGNRWLRAGLLRKGYRPGAQA